MYNSNDKGETRAIFLIPAVCCVIAVVLAASLEYTNAFTTVTSGDTDGLAVRTALYALIGAAAAYGASRLDLSLLERYSVSIGAAGLALTALTFTSLGFSPEGSDDRAWLSLGFITVQPAEVLKLCFIVTFSAHICKVGNVNRPVTLLLLLLHAAVPAALVWAQGDQGTAVIFVVIAAVMLFSGGLAYGYAAAALCSLPVGASLAFGMLRDHQKKRIEVLFDPSLDPLGTGFQQLQSRRAIAGGGLFGHGLFSNGEELVYVSQSQNDFILAYAAQAAGMLICGVMIVLLFRLCYAVAASPVRTRFAGSVTAGVGALFFSHTLINTAMALGFMPVIGVPLPFFSSGGTAMVTMLTAAGLVCAARKQKAASAAVP